MRYLLLSLLTTSVMAEPADPFADPFGTPTAEQTDPFAQPDPFSSTPVETTVESPYQHELSLLGYYQNNNVNEGNRFNPGLTEFSDDQQLGVLDWQVKAQWTPNLQGRLRTTLQWQRDSLPADSHSDSKAKVLEGYLNWTSDNYAWQGQIGRIKTEWSNGYNWSLTNLLRPYRDRPFIDLDDPEQQVGWDMVTLGYTSGNWHYSVLAADLDLDEGDDNPSRQYVTRVGYQGSHDYELILHKIPGQTLDAAASFSSLLSDNITFRMEWSLQHQREQDEASLNLSEPDKSTFNKFLIGGAYTAPGGTNFRLEYLKSQHGFTDEQWQQVRNNSAIAYRNIINNQASGDDYNYLGNGLSSLANGQLRQNYLYLMITSKVSEDLWQYRQSVQVTLDDDSQLHRLELMKSWGEHLSGRLQWEVFNGCNTCEYGLNPNKNSLRLVMKWTF